MNTEYFAQKLAEEKIRLESEMSEIGRKNPLVPDDWEVVPAETGSEPDSIDQASNVTENEDNAAVLADLEARYDTVLFAQRSIEKGVYGICEVCNEPIEEARLNADPAAMTCIAHK